MGDTRVGFVRLLEGTRAALQAKLKPPDRGPCVSDDMYPYLRCVAGVNERRARERQARERDIYHGT
jgi:hypothetical protein